jgi:hypothetical protein
MTRPERRQTYRTTLERHAYINIEPNNGGIVLNVSSDGLCFHSFDPVKRNGPIRFWFSDHHQRIEADAELAWMDETQKGGLRFRALPAEAREQINKWMGEPAVPRGAQEVSAPPMPSRAFFTSSASRPKAPTAPRDYIPQAAPSPDAKGAVPWTGFSGGLVTGLLLAAVVAAGLVFNNYRREFGESLIRMGERFAGQSQAQAQVESPVPPTVPPARQTAPPQGSTLVQQTTSPLPPVVSASKKAVSPPQAVSPAVQKALTVTPPASRPEKVVPQPLAATLPPAQAKTEPAAAVSATYFAPSPAVESTVKAPAATPAISSAPPKVSLPSTSAASDQSNTLAKPVAVPQPRPVNHPTLQAEESKTDNSDASSEMYFEIGKFKDALQAHDTTDKLAQLGFPATAVQKGHLWRSSYHVLVGPYGDENTAKVTHENLVSRGYKPRPFERGSRSISFRSGLTLNGARAPVGDYTVSWESYVNDATVKLEHENSVVARGDARWVKRDIKYAHDAYVYRRNMDGSRTLLEIHFGGMRQALVFGKS